MNAVITGATRGMGRAISGELAAAGYNLAVCSRDAQELAAMIGEFRSSWPALKIVGLATDCADRDSLELFASFVQQHFKETDVLVNNAGMFVPADIVAEEADVLDTQWALNVFAPYFLSRIFGRGMRSRKSGHIFNICSIASIEAVPGAGSYTVTKHALLGLTRALRDALAADLVKVTAILPGATLSSSWDAEEVNAREMIAVSDIASVVINCLRMSAGACPELIVIRPVNRAD